MCELEKITNMVQGLVHKDILVDINHYIAEPTLPHYYILRYKGHSEFPTTGATDEEILKSARLLVSNSNSTD